MPPASTAFSKTEQIISRALLAILLTATVAVLGWNYDTDIFSRVSVYYNEGPLLDQAMRLMRGEAIYRGDVSQPPYTVANYGPVFQLLQLPFLAWFGPSMAYGRLISAAAHVAAALFAALIIKRLTQDRFAAAVAGAMALASPMVAGALPLYRVDVLAQALSLAGVYGALFARRRMDIFSALCFTAAIYTKQSYGFTGPASVFCYLLWQKEYRRAVTLAAWVAALAASVMAVGQWLTQGGFFFSLVTANINEYSFAVFIRYFAVMLLLSGFAALAVPLLAMTKPPVAGARAFSFIYLACAALVTAAAGKIGANHGYFSEWQIALCFVMGTLASACRNVAARWPVFLALLAAQMAVYILFIVQFPYQDDVRRRCGELAELQEIIGAERGPVLADAYMGMIALSGRPLYFQPFEMKQLLRFGHWSQEAFVRDLQQGKFPLIIIESGSDATVNERWTPQMLQAIAGRYEVARNFCGNVQMWERR